MKCQAERYEQILARRAEGISQNLHRALARHKRLVTEDITTALIEHVRSSIMYERQHLRELDALRSDVSNAANKHVAAKPPPPRPTVIPPLEDFSRPSIPRPASVQSNTAASPVARTASVPPTATALPSDPLAPGSSIRTLPQLSSLPKPPSNFVSHSSSMPSPLQSPGAGPSTPPLTPSGRSPSFSPPSNNNNDGGPPLGGRFADGTKSMFVKHTPSPLVPSSAPSTPSKAAFQSPLHSATVGSPHPLAQSVSSPLSDSSAPRANGRAGADEGLDPLGMGRPAYMSASVRVQPTRPRLDAREAASKLANMF